MAVLFFNTGSAKPMQAGTSDFLNLYRKKPPQAIQR